MVFTLAALRALEFTGPAVNGQHLVPGVFFAFEATGPDVLRVESRPGSLVGFAIGDTLPGRWLTLHVVMGATDFSACKIIGFACRARAEGPATFRVCLRSGVEAGHRDVMIGAPVETGPAGTVHLEVLTLADSPILPLIAPWRELVVFFQTDTPAITLEDFRLIVI
jgi:hypothetical protein